MAMEAIEVLSRLMKIVQDQNKWQMNRYSISGKINGINKLNKLSKINSLRNRYSKVIPTSGENAHSWNTKMNYLTNIFGRQKNKLNLDNQIKYVVLYIKRR